MPSSEGVTGPCLLAFSITTFIDALLKLPVLSPHNKKNRDYPTR
jgi:hypothetical protein